MLKERNIRIGPYAIRDENNFFFGLTDGIFKSVYFGREEELTKFLLESILGIKVDSFVIESSELRCENVGNKGQALDLLVSVNDDLVCNIEINTSYSKEIHKRNFSYATHVFYEIVRKGVKYSLAKKVVHIDITRGLPNNYDGDGEELYQSNLNNKVVYVRDIVMLVKNMDKIMEHWYNRSDKSEYPYIEKYAYLIVMYLGKEEILELINGDYLHGHLKEMITKVGKRVIEMNEKESWHKSLWTYEEDLEWHMDLKEMQGYERGVKQKESALIKKLAEKKLDVKTISEYVDVPVSKVKKVLSL